LGRMDKLAPTDGVQVNVATYTALRKRSAIGVI